MKSQLVARFVDDPDRFSEEELQLLLLLVREDAGMARELRDQLVSHDWLSRALAADRANFEAQMAQRIRGLAAPRAFSERVLSATKAGAGRAPASPDVRMRVGPADGVAVAQECVPGAGWAGWWISGIAAGLLLAVGLFLGGRLGELRLPVGAPVVRGDVEARVEAVHGDVFSQKGNVRGYAARGYRIAAGEELVTGTGRSGATVVCGETSRLELGAGTRMLWNPPAGGWFGQGLAQASWRLYLDRGSMEAHVSRGWDEAPIAFETPHGEAVVVGTEFAVRVDAFATQVDLKTGRMELSCRYDGDSAVLLAGQVAQIGTSIAVGEKGVSGPGPAGEPVPGLQALYVFAEGQGGTVHDTAGVAPALDLRIEDSTAVQWLPGGGLAVLTPTLLATELPAARLTQACRSSNELTIETWIKPATTSERLVGPSRIVSLSGGTGTRNFTLGMNDDSFGPPELGSYALRLRTEAANPNGRHPVWTAPGVATDARISHVVFTRDAAGRAALYVDGVSRPIWLVSGREQKSATERFDGDFACWSDEFPLLLAGEIRNTDPSQRFWLGEYHLVAVYSRALPAETVLGNFGAGPHRQVAQAAGE